MAQSAVAVRLRPTASKAARKLELDHSVFVPFLLIYPQAEIPVVQLSLRQDLDPAAHLAIAVPWRRCAMKAC